MMRSDAAASYTRMYASARKAGVNLQPVSAYRSTAQQARLYKLYRQGRGNLAARPGRSNHEKGIAVDVAVGSTRSKAYKWLHAHAAQFGFKRTVPIEPWHWEFRR